MAAGVTYRLIDSELVSEEWLTFLTSAREDGVSFRVNEGHRTMARQLWFYNCMRSRKCNDGNLAAFPSPNAPHIRSFRIDHAIDVESSTGGADRLVAYGRKVGMVITRPVRGEPWHLEVSAKALRAFHKKHADPLNERERRLVDELTTIRRNHGKVWNDAEKRRAEEIKEWLRDDRAAIKKAAERTGWERANRRARYAALHVAIEG